MQLTKKLKFFIISFTYFISGISIYFIDFIDSALIIFFPIIVTTGVAIYFIRGQYKSQRYFSKLILILLYIVTSQLFLFTFPLLNIYIKVIFLFISNIFLYFLMLSTNIYLVSELQEKNIPLLQPARLFVNMGIIFTSFYGSSLIFKIYDFPEYPIIDAVLIVVLLFLFFYLLFKNIIWSYRDEIIGEFGVKEYEIVKIYNIMAALLLSQFGLIMSFINYETFGKGILLASSVYVLIIVLQSYICHKLNRRIYIEITLILFVTLLLVYFI